MSRLYITNKGLISHKQTIGFRLTSPIYFCGILSTVAQKNPVSILLGVILARIILLGSSLADFTEYGIWIRSIWQHSDNFMFWFYRFFANTLLRTHLKTKAFSLLQILRPQRGHVYFLHFFSFLSLVTGNTVYMFWCVFKL